MMRFGKDIEEAARRIRALMTRQAVDKARAGQVAAEAERLRAGGWRSPVRPVEPGPTLAHAQAAIEAGFAHDAAVEAEAARRLAVRNAQLAQAEGGVALPLPPRLPDRRESGGDEVQADPLAGWPDLRAPLANIELRGHDAYGKGRWGEGLRTDENGNPRPHWGMDLVATPGTPVYAPTAGHFQIGDPYGNDPEKRGLLDSVRVEIPGEEGSIERIVRLLYVEPDSRLRPGQWVEPGTLLGMSQGLQDVYPTTPEGNMTDHVHVQLEQPVNTKLDPMSLLARWREQSEHARRQRIQRLERIERM